MIKIQVRVKQVPQRETDGFKNGWCEEDDENRMLVHPSHTSITMHAPTIRIGDLSYILADEEIYLVAHPYVEFHREVHDLKNYNKILDGMKAEAAACYPDTLKTYINFIITDGV